MVERGTGKDQQGLKAYLALPLEIKRNISSSALGTGYKKPRTPEHRKEGTQRLPQLLILILRSKEVGRQKPPSFHTDWKKRM